MEPSLSPRRIVLTAGIFEGGLGLVGLALGYLLERPPWAQFDNPAVNALWGVAASLPLLLGLVLSVRYPVGPLRSLRDLTQELVVPMFRDCSLADLAIVACLAGVGEELLFRGVVQEAISHRFGSAIGLTAASVLFGLMHPVSRAYAILTGIVGAYLGGLFLVSDSLVAPMVTHAVYDFVALVYLVRRLGASP